MIPVYWLTFDEKIPARGYWDSAFIDAVLSGKVWRTVKGYDYKHFTNVSEVTESECGVVIIPAKAFEFHVDQINLELGKLGRAVVILAEDEDSSFDYKALEHHNMSILVMNPMPGRHEGVIGIPNFWPSGTMETLYKVPVPSKSDDLFFAGQNNHDRRKAALDAMRELPANFQKTIMETNGFAQGMNHEEYLGNMLNAKVVACPAGQVTPDSFRLFEAMECGAVPIADGQAPREGYQEGYWNMTLGDVPFPVTTNWGELRQLITGVLENYPATSNHVFAWWQAWKRTFCYQMDSLINLPSEEDKIADYITVLVTTSPIKSHPDTDIIEQTIASIRQSLPSGCEILIGIDGVRPKQEHMRKNYEEYIRRLVWLCGHHWDNVLPIIMPEHVHQANVTRELLKEVRTPYILFVEHDTPLLGTIRWDKCLLALDTGFTNHIRFHYDVAIHPEHQYLMRPEKIEGGQPEFMPTVQWSQRPHIANTDFYRSLLERYFAPECRTMIEDLIYSPVSTQPWEQWRLTIYNPAPLDVTGIKRSDNLDGRGDEPKYEMHY